MVVQHCLPSVTVIFESVTLSKLWQQFRMYMTWVFFVVVLPLKNNFKKRMN